MRIGDRNEIVDLGVPLAAIAEANGTPFTVQPEPNGFGVQLVFNSAEDCENFVSRVSGKLP